LPTLTGAVQNQLGSTTYGTAFPTTLTSGSNQLFSTITIGSVGIFLLCFWYSAAITVIPTSDYFTIRASPQVPASTIRLSGQTVAPNYIWGTTAINAGNDGSSFSIIMNVTTAGTLIINTSMLGAGASLILGGCSATRIA
jgi:hypothetical protein